MSNMQSATSTLRATSRKVKARRFPAWIGVLPWILPGLVLFFVFVQFPILLQVLMSFGPDGSIQIFDDPIRTLQNFSIRHYITLISDRNFWSSLLNNIQFAIGTVTGKIVFSFLLALALNGAFAGRIFFRAVFFIPVVISFVAIGTIWSFMLQFQFGAVNETLKMLGLEALALNWLGDPDIAMWSLIGVDIWKWTGFHTVIYLAGLQAIPTDLTEAAEMDGATGFQRVRDITIPLMLPYTITNVIIATLGAFSVFDLMFVMTKGGPFGATEVVMTQVYLNAFQFQRFGYASAQATVLLIIIALVSVVLLRYSRKATAE